MSNSQTAIRLKAKPNKLNKQTFKTEFLVLDQGCNYIHKSKNCDHLVGSGVDIVSLENHESSGTFKFNLI